MNRGNLMDKNKTITFRCDKCKRKFVFDKNEFLHKYNSCSCPVCDPLGYKSIELYKTDLLYNKRAVLKTKKIFEEISKSQISKRQVNT